MKIFVKMYHGIRYVLNHLLLVATSLIPRNKKMIIFGAWGGNKFDDNPRFLFEYVVSNHSDFNVYWISSNKNIVAEVNAKGYPALYSHSLKAYYLALRSRFVYYCLGVGDIGNNLRYCLGGCVLINSWHGIPLKKIMNDDKISRGDIGLLTKVSENIRNFVTPNSYVICTSENLRPIYQSAFQKNEKKILNLGQARNDFFFQNNVGPYRELYKEKKIILYMPTHRQEGKKVMDMNTILDLDHLNELCKKTNSVLLIKKHYYHSKEKSIINKYDSIIEITKDNPETMELLKSADILITDYSSCFIDYLLLNRPIVFYCYDLNDYLINDRDMYFNYKEIAPGPICNTCTELIHNLQDILVGVDKYLEKREKTLDFLYSKENRKSVSELQLNSISKL